MQDFALTTSFIVVGVLALIFFLFIFRSSHEGGDAPGLKAEGTRWLLICAMILFTIIATYSTLKPWPHQAVAGVTGSALTVKVNGAQWYWDVSHDTLPINTLILFEVSAQDVNHGFALYDPDGRIVTQTQAMPGYVNKLLYTFEKTGTYKVLCLEFCGPAHHEMEHEFTLVEKGDFTKESN